MNSTYQRTALITGASRGIGLVLAKQLCATGVRCILLARDQEALASAARDIRAEGGEVDVLPFDLESLHNPAALAIELAPLTDRLDVLVVNAAMGGIRTPLPEYPADLWRRLFQVNVHSVQSVLAAAHPMLLRSPAGRVVFLSTGVASKWKANTGAYGVSKAALEAIAGIYAVETEGTNIRSNVVNPGPTRTDMRAEAYPKEAPGDLKTPEDIAPLFLELAAPECSLHGAVIIADAWLEKRFRAP